MFLICSRFFRRRERSRKPERLKRTSALESTTSLRSSKQSRLNSRKNLLMSIMPRRRSRWVGLFLLGLSVNVYLYSLLRITKFQTTRCCQDKMTCFVSFPQSLAEDLDCCGRTLSELDAAVQDFGRRNPLLAKQLGDAISKLSEMHHHTTRLADCRNNWLKKVCCFPHVNVVNAIT